MTQSSGVQAVVGGQSLFAQAAMILGALKLRPEERISRADARVLAEAEEAIHDADGWRKFCANRGPCVNADAKQTYELFSRAAGAVQSGDAWVSYWGGVHGVGCTIRVLADGGRCDPQQLEAAEALCLKVSGMSSVPSKPRLVQ